MARQAGDKRRGLADAEAAHKRIDLQEQECRAAEVKQRGAASTRRSRRCTSSGHDEGRRLREVPGRR